MPFTTETYQSINDLMFGFIASQVLPLGGSKGYGLSRLLDSLGMDPKHVLAIGDAENDLEVRGGDVVHFVADERCRPWEGPQIHPLSQSPDSTISLE